MEHMIALEAIWTSLSKLEKTQICKRFQVLKGAPKGHKKWTTEESLRMGELWASGLPAKVIAQSMGRTELSIKCHLWQIGQPRQPEVVTIKNIQVGEEVLRGPDIFLPKKFIRGKITKIIPECETVKVLWEGLEREITARIGFDNKFDLIKIP
jgi:hypothetical protein